MRRSRTTKTARARHLAACPLFDSLGASERQALAAIAGLRSYEDGECLFAQGERAEAFHVVVAGQVKVSRTGRDGREQVLHLFGPGEPVGEVPAFEGGQYPAQARCLGPVRALHIPLAAFLELAAARPELLLDMLACLSRRLRHFVQLIDDLALKEVSARLAKVLLDLAVCQHSDAVQLETSKAMLASRIGTIAETLSRTLAKMQKQGVVSVRGRSITIQNRPALQALAAGEKL